MRSDVDFGYDQAACFGWLVGRLPWLAPVAVDIERGTGLRVECGVARQLFPGSLNWTGSVVHHGEAEESRRKAL